MHNQNLTDNEIWVFLSHSNKDYESVRLLRNMLEEEGYRPIMFFLLCLNDDEEIGELIKREIDCRKRFILCDSPNARQSAWVQKEVEYIKGSHRFYHTIQLDAPIESIRDQILQFRKDSTIFFESSMTNLSLISLFKDALRKDMECIIHNLSDTITTLTPFDFNGIDYALENGFLFFLLPDGFTDSPFMKRELQYALRHRLASRFCIFTDEPTKAFAFLQSLTGVYALIEWNVIDYRIQNGEVFINEEKLYFGVMIDRIREGAAQGEPVSMYWLARYNLHYEGRYEFGSRADSFRRYTLDLARRAVEAGYSPAVPLYKEIYDDIRHNYPEDFLDSPSTSLGFLDLLISLFPECADYYADKGSLLMITGNQQGALEMWRMVLSLEPEFLSKHKDGSLLYNQLKKEGLV